jgi:tetracycline repressor-like protein
LNMSILPTVQPVQPRLRRVICHVLGKVPIGHVTKTRRDSSLWLGARGSPRPTHGGSRRDHERDTSGGDLGDTHRGHDLLFGALSEGALLVARADDREAALDEVEATVTRLLDGLKKEQPR